MKNPLTKNPSKYSTHIGRILPSFIFPLLSFVFKKRLILFLIPAISFANPCNLHAQDKFIKEYKIAAFAGFRYTERDSFRNTDNLDFMNYFNSYSEIAMPEYQYIGFSAHLIFRNNLEADLKVAMYDDFIPNNLNLTLQYFPLKRLGLSMGFYGNPLLINDFPAYHKINDAGFYGDMNRGFRQRYVYEYGIIAGPVLKLESKSIHLMAKVNAGVSAYSRFTEHVRNKKINSNLLIEYNYETRFSPAFFFLPEAELDIDLFTSRNAKYGFQIQTSWYTSSRSIDYDRTTWEWTRTLPQLDKIDSPAHSIKKLEIDLGIYMRF